MENAFQNLEVVAGFGVLALAVEIIYLAVLWYCKFLMFCAQF